MTSLLTGLAITARRFTVTIIHGLEHQSLWENIFNMGICKTLRPFLEWTKKGAYGKWQKQKQAEKKKRPTKTNLIRLMGDISSSIEFQILSGLFLFATFEHL